MQSNLQTKEIELSDGGKARTLPIFRVAAFLGGGRYLCAHRLSDIVTTLRRVTLYFPKMCCFPDFPKPLAVLVNSGRRGNHDDYLLNLVEILILKFPAVPKTVEWVRF